MKPVVNIAELAPERDVKGELYDSSEAPIASLIGLAGLGARYCEVPPGKSACPFHNHHVEDEMFLVLEGNGTYRFGSERYAIKAGDVLGAPAGGQDTAHQILNTGSVPLRYIGISTKSPIDVCEYPDSGKFLVKSHSGEGHLRHIGRAGQNNLDYWDGEPGARDAAATPKLEK